MVFQRFDAFPAEYYSYQIYTIFHGKKKLLQEVFTMNKNIFAKHPPMGWNSYDYYDTTVNEEQVRQNAAFMAEHLKEYGWEYIVVDIE